MAKVTDRRRPPSSNSIASCRAPWAMSVCSRRAKSWGRSACERAFLIGLRVGVLIRLRDGSQARRLHYLLRVLIGLVDVDQRRVHLLVPEHLPQLEGGH